MNLYRMFRVYVTLFCIPLETISKIPELVIFTFFFVTLHICEQNQLLDQKGGMNEWMNEWKCNITRKSNITQYWWDSYNVLKRTTSIKIMQFHLGKHVAEDHHGVRLSVQSSPTLLSNWLIKDAYVTQFWFEISPVFVWRMVGKEEGGGNRSVDGSGDRTNLKPKNCNTDDSSQNCSLQRPIFVSDFMEKPAQDHCF